MAKLQIVVLLSLSCCIPAALAAPHCSQHTTRGHWAYSCEGEIGGIPTRQLGSCNASASGFWQCSGWVNLGGTILAHALRGQAHNNPDCTGTISYENTLNGQPAGTLDIVYVIYDNGSAIKGLPTNHGSVVACSLNRIGIPISGSP
jgi:hypothetical protein